MATSLAWEVVIFQFDLLLKIRCLKNLLCLSSKLVEVSIYLKSSPAQKVLVMLLFSLSSVLDLCLAKTINLLFFIAVLFDLAYQLSLELEIKQKISF